MKIVVQWIGYDRHSSECGASESRSLHDELIAG
jgi:hypothetical protein